MVLTMASGPADTGFLFTLYAGTRRDEVAAWGWDPAQEDAFLRMQFDLQQRAYAMQYPDAEHRLVLVEGEPVGRLITCRRESEIRLVDIAILPAFRNAGLGTTVMLSLQAEAAEAARPLRLHVAIGSPARRLYDRLGFRQTGENETHCAMEWQPA